MVFSDLIQFVQKHIVIFIFYSAVILFLILFRKKVDVQGKIIFLLRMKWGIKWMDKYAQKYRQWIILLGYIGTGVGFIGMVVISYLLIKNLISLMITPAATSGVSLVLPGMNIPGLGILPFWHWLVAIFIIAVVHEFSHGIVARAHNVEVKNTGIVFFGPIIGAFVEPNEKKLNKEKDIHQYSVLAAGAFSNILLALVALVLLTGVVYPLQQSMIEPTGFTFDAYYGENYPFEQEGIPTQTLIQGIDNVPIINFQQFSEQLQCKAPGEQITLMTPEKEYDITLAENPNAPGKSFLGIQTPRNEFDIKEKYQHGIWKVGYFTTSILAEFFRWLFLLSFGIGLFNLLPLPIVDGGRMAQVFLQKLKGQEKGDKMYRRVGLFFLLILLLNLFYPLLSKLF